MVGHQKKPKKNSGAYQNKLCFRPKFRLFLSSFSACKLCATEMFGPFGPHCRRRDQAKTPELSGPGKGTSMQVQCSAGYLVCQGQRLQFHLILPQTG